MDDEDGHLSQGNLSDYASQDQEQDLDEVATISEQPTQDYSELQSEAGAPLDLPPYNFKDLPVYACTYCGIHNPNSVTRCRECGKWFCNARSGAASHSILHMIKSRHKEIELHPDSQLKDTPLQCYECGKRNLCLLGFISSKPPDNYIILICREPCLRTTALHNDDDIWSFEAWQPLIEASAILEWVVTPPSAAEIARSRRLRPDQINKLEEIWREIPAASLEDIKRPTTQLRHVQLRYETGREYRDVFEPLIREEAEYDKQVKDSMKQSGLEVKWEKVGRGTVAYFLFSKEESQMRVVQGDQLLMKCVKGETNVWQSRGSIIKTTNNQEVGLFLHKAPSQEIIKSPDSQFSVQFVWKSTSFTRMLQGLKLFVHNQKTLTRDVYYKLLGHEFDERLLKFKVPSQVTCPGLPELNSSQVNAVRRALKSPLCLIQGPPGTGKTVTSAMIVNQIVQNLKHLNEPRSRLEPMLVCAPSNIAVDLLAERIHQTGLRVVRVTAKSRESISTAVDFLTLHQQIKELVKNSKEFAELAPLQAKREEQGDLFDDDLKRWKRLMSRAEGRILGQAEVICATCISAFDKRLEHFDFGHVLIDQATQATEPECLLPLLKNCRQAVFVGDHCQLGPVVMSKKAAKAGLNQSLFERLVRLGMRPLRLQVQYRMHSCLSAFPSKTFYEGSLQNGISDYQRTMKQLETAFPWPNIHRPMFFYNIGQGKEELSSSATSFLNRSEAEHVKILVNALLKNQIKASQIGVITPYEGQRAYLSKLLVRSGALPPQMYKELEVASVDSFQGREKDFIILTCVRSEGIGFLRDARRLNVAITRAKYGLVVCGNAQLLQQNPLWNNLLSHFMSQGLLVEGALNNLKASNIILKEPVKYLPDQRQFVDQLKQLDGPNRRWGADEATFAGQNFRHSEFGHDAIKQSQPPVLPPASRYMEEPEKALTGDNLLDGLGI